MFVLVCLHLASDAHADDVNLLFLGNSYTVFNDLDQVTIGLFEAAAPTDTHAAVRLAGGGYTFPMHLAQADGTSGDTAWSEALVTGSTEWDWVVLQDQSQIPGFPSDNTDYLASLAALGPLDAMVIDKHGQSILLMTWGRLHGDTDNPDIYPDYPTMQGLLATGYTNYAASITTGSRTAWVAPAGLAWRHIYDAEVASGVDPTAPGSLFYALYFDDGSHPSPLGTYLTACVVYTTITGNDPVGLPAPETVPADAVLDLQEACAATVFHGTPDLVYPWQDPPDTGSVDTGSDTDTGGDTDTGDARGESSDTHSAPDGDTGVDTSDGCGCAAAGDSVRGTGDPVGPALGAALTLAALARRRSL